MLYRPTELLKYDAFCWDDKVQHAFHILKSTMITAPVLSLPDFTKQFVLQIDDSGTGIGAFLTQDGHPISFFSKIFCRKLINSPTYVRD